VPAPGEAWVDASLLEALGLALGDPLLLGDASCASARHHRSGARPRRRLHQLRAARDGQRGRPAGHQPVQPASRITYRFAVAGDDAPVKRFTEMGRGRGKKPPTCAACASSRWKRAARDAPDAGPRREIPEPGGAAGGPAERRGGGLAARGFAAKHLDDCAMLRVLGQPSAPSRWPTPSSSRWSACSPARSAWRWASPCTTSSCCCWPAWSKPRCRPPRFWPVLFGMGMGLTLLFAFGLPPVLQLAQVPPLRVIRRDVGNLKPASLRCWASAWPASPPCCWRPAATSSWA
jgi:putative ABC transport system permease protein